MLVFGLCLLAYCTVYLLLGEQSYTNFGIRWDPAFYLDATQKLDVLITSKQIPPYGFQRIVPAGIVHSFMSLLAIPLTQENIIIAYDVYTVIVILLSLLMWCLIGKAANLSATAFWMGTIALFCTSAVLKIYLYMPLNTDSMAFLLGLVLLYAWVSKNKPLMVATIFVSSFTWPTAIYLGIILLIGNAVQVDLLKRPAEKIGDRNVPAFVLSALAVAAITSLILLLIALDIKLPRGTPPMLTDLLPISLLLLGAYVFWVFYSCLLPLDLRKENLLRALKSISTVNLVLCFVLLFSNRTLIELFSSNQTGGFGILSFIRNVSLTSINMPLKFLVAHATYYGPIVLFFVFFWKNFRNNLLRYDVGLLLFMGIHLAQSIATESRQLVFAYPFFVFILVQSLQHIKFKASFLAAFLFASLLFSRFWYPINRVPFPHLDDPIEHFQSFPWQSFVMYHGPWISFEVYLILLPIIIVTGLVFYRHYVRPAKALEKSQASGML